MVIDCIETSVPGRFFLKSGIVFLRASLATSHEATVMPPPPDKDSPHPASVPPPSRAAPASPAPPSLKNCRRFMPPLTHLTLLPVDKPSPFRSTAQDAASARGYSSILMQAAGNLCVRGYQRWWTSGRISAS